MRALVLSALLLGCRRDDVETSDTSDDEMPPPSVFTLTTFNGVDLVADWYPSRGVGRPTVVLLHKYAPGHSRADWPAFFIDALRAHDWAVLVPDLRGCGASSGVYDEWTTETVRDLALFTQWSLDSGHAEIAVLSSLNSGTLLNNYAYQAASMGTGPVPAAYGYISGDSSVEAFVPMELLPVRPAVFVGSGIYLWAEEQVAEADPDWGWVYHRYMVNELGTDIFATAPEMAGDLESFYQRLWPNP